MVVVELGDYDLKGENYPKSSTISGMYWSDYDPKDSYYYFMKEIEKTTDWDKFNRVTTPISTDVEPPTSPIRPFDDDDKENIDPNGSSA